MEMLSRVAALYDIHGNLPALEAVLEQVRRERVDRIVVGGDIFPGPMAHAVLAELREAEIPVQFIRGNCETAVLAERAGREVALPDSVRETMRWSAARLDDEQERFVASWPLSIQLDVDGLGSVLFCHATPRDDNEIFVETTPEERVAPAFDAVDAALVICGHTHMQFERNIGRIRVANAGSVGMPFGEPGAHWLLVGSQVEFRRTHYDLHAAAARITATQHPGAEHFAARYVLQPPSASEMLHVLAQREIK